MDVRATFTNQVKNPKKTLLKLLNICNTGPETTAT